MADEKSKKDKDSKPKANKPADPKAEAKAAKAKEKAAKDKEKAKAEKATAAEAAPKAEAPKPERKPADPRAKLLKKFHGKLLPKGELRDRHKALLVRWNSGEDHGNVTTEELKSLLDAWRATRTKAPKKAAARV
jgi:hypothetical protein